MGAAALRVTVRMLGAHRAYLPDSSAGGAVTLEFPGDTVRLGTVRDSLGMQMEVPRIVFYRGEPVSDDQVLFDGDEVVFVSPSGGG
jgi:hypothetical protein